MRTKATRYERVIGMSLTTPEEIQELQRKLYLKAKQEPDYRFYSLYDKICRQDVLTHAYRLSKANKGMPGVDGKTFEDIEEYGIEQYLKEIQEELLKKEYIPDAVLRVYIPKAGGGKRPLGIPSIRDRIVQASVKIILEPIFEADFTENAYAYRSGRNANLAVREVHKGLKAGYVQVVDADLSKYFDTIPHADLLRSVARRISDGEVLHLIKLFLKATVEERTGKGKKIRKESGNRGTPQGGVLSPLLANIYMRRFLKAWEIRGNTKKYQSRIINYADDFVILCKRDADKALLEAKSILEHIGLKLNEEKTKICNIWEESFDFLGYSFGVQYYFGKGKYIGVSPSKKSVNKIKTTIRKKAGVRTCWQDEEIIIREVNNVIRGWTNYFSYGTLWKTYIPLENFLWRRIRKWLLHKHRIDGMGRNQIPAERIYQEMGLIKITEMLMC